MIRETLRSRIIAAIDITLRIYMALERGLQKTAWFFLRRIAMAMKKKKVAKKKAAKRELLDTGTDKRYVRRNSKGEFKESDDMGSVAFARREL